MVGQWMLCVNVWGLSGRFHGWPVDALRERMGSEWTLSWLAHGCSAGTNNVRVVVTMVGKYRASPTKPPSNLGTRLHLHTYIHACIHNYIHRYIHTCIQTDIYA